MIDDGLKERLISIARTMVLPGKGILAADESSNTMGKRLNTISVENTPENRRLYRELIITTGKELGRYIGGIILSSETLYQKDSNGRRFTEILEETGICIGVKVDKGLVNIGNTDETITQGLDGLGDRCKEYYKAGARFAKWRCALKIGKQEPSLLSINENSNILARYASICQHNGIMPIIEPEILMDGDHNLDKAIEISTTVLSSVYVKLAEHGVLLEGTLLKPSMVCPGVNCNRRYSSQEIARATISVLRKTVPKEVPGIVFLSGGQSEEEASRNLNEINRISSLNPWALSFSYGRALQKSVLKTWNGKEENKRAAQMKLISRAGANSLAAIGKYTPGCAEDSVSRESNYLKSYKY